MTGAVRAHPRTALAIGACALFLLAAAAVEGGLVRGGHYGDTSLYARDAHLIVHDGLVPYRDFTLEYPPGSLAAFLPPAVSSAHYTELFRVLMALCGLGALVLSARLLADGARIVAHDPIAEEQARRLISGVEFAATPLEAVQDADAVVLVTEWPEFLELDWSEVAAAMRGDLVVDGRNALDPQALRDAGLSYEGIGRR